MYTTAGVLWLELKAAVRSWSVPGLVLALELFLQVPGHLVQLVVLQVEQAGGLTGGTPRDRDNTTAARPEKGVFGIADNWSIFWYQSEINCEADVPTCVADVTISNLRAEMNVANSGDDLLRGIRLLLIVTEA